MINPYTKENPGNFANDRERASRAGKKGGKIGGPKGGKTTADRYLSDARRMSSE